MAYARCAVEMAVLQYDDGPLFAARPIHHRHLPWDRIRKMDEAREFPLEAYNALADAGYLGLFYPEELGGMGGSYKDITVFLETLGYYQRQQGLDHLRPRRRLHRGHRQDRHPGAPQRHQHDPRPHQHAFFGDSRVGPIGGGTSEIQRNIIAKQMDL